MRPVSRKQPKLEVELARLETMSPAELASAWAEHFDTEPPGIAPGLIRRLIGHRMQEKRFGPLPAAIVREFDRAAAGPTPAPVRPASSVTPGTRFIREWQGRTIAVEAVEGGFRWQDREYRSLSQIAREVTGAHWSGPRFFGLTQRG